MSLQTSIIGLCGVQFRQLELEPWERVCRSSFDRLLPAAGDQSLGFSSVDRVELLEVLGRLAEMG